MRHEKEKKWIPSRVVKQKDERVCVSIENEIGTKDSDASLNRIENETWFDLQDFENCTLPMGKTNDEHGECGDLALLEEINQAAILHHLIRRYENGHSFTRCGELLLVLHPPPQASSPVPCQSKYFQADSGMLRLEFGKPLLSLTILSFLLPQWEQFKKKRKKKCRYKTLPLHLMRTKCLGKPFVP